MNGWSPGSGLLDFAALVATSLVRREPNSAKQLEGSKTSPTKSAKVELGKNHSPMIGFPNFAS